jgi:hypothetical protein
MMGLSRRRINIKIPSASGSAGIKGKPGGFISGLMHLELELFPSDNTFDG